MSEYQYPLYFEANDLTDRERERVRRYFQKRRESGGGECSPIERVGDKIYKICFEEAEAQERVLNKQFHTVSLPSRELCLTVTQTESALNLDQSSAKQTQASTTPNTKCLEKIFKLEIFLLYYLRDNLKADKVLRKQLDAINCTVEFNNEEEEAVVRGDIDKGSGGGFSSAAENWEMQVDRVFISFTERYLCYHAVEPKLGKMLLEDLSGASDDIKVYTENGYHVVVGEKEVVEEKIDILQKNMPTCKEVPVVEKHFKLVEEEFSREARANFPEVKISRRDGMVTLEGPPMAVQAGVSKLDELIEKIQKKRVPLDSALLSFMRLSGADSKYQTRFQQSLRNPVALEIGTDLLLSSLSIDALDEAEAALQRDLSVARVALQGAEAVPPDLDKLKQIMTTAKNKANSGGYRVDVSFTPGLGGTSDVTLQLVGYTENVNSLKETLHDFQMNQVGTQETLKLPHPDMVDCFDTILNLIGMKQTGVNINASPFPYPCVVLSGPRCEVQKVQASLTATLASLTLDTLILEGPAALQYFQGNGRESTELIENNCHVIIKAQGVNPETIRARSNSNPIPRANFNKVRTNISANVVNKPSLEIKIGRLEDEQANVLVVPMLNRQINSTHIGNSLMKKGGSAMTSNFDLMASNCVLGPGDVLQVDVPPSLGCSKLFFIECLPWDGVRGQSVQALSQGLKRCLDLCEQQKLQSVAFPVIGPGVVLKFPLSEAIQVLTDTIRQFGSSTSSGSLSNIRVVVKPDNPDSSKFYHDIYRHLSSNMNQGGQAIFRSLTSDLDDITTTVGGGIKLQLVFGDITNETTDAVVNTTDFVNFHNDGVCKDILTVAGPQVEAELKAANVRRGDIVQTQPGYFPCKYIYHVCGERDAGVIEQIVSDIIGDCETFGFTSVAIPAICAGAGGLDPDVVANAILRGVKAATSSTTFVCLTNIRLILFKINVFMAFKKKALEIYPTAAVSNVPALLLTQVQQQRPSSPVSGELRSLQIPPISQNSTFLFMGITRKNVDDAKKMLKDLCEAQCSTQTFSKEELAHFAAEDLEELEDLAKTHGLSMQKDHPSQGCITVSGLKDAVSQVRQMTTACLQSSLRRQAKIRSQEDLYNRVVWCIMGPNGNWERLPKKANHDLENTDITYGIEDAQGVSWRVDLQRSEATCPASGRKATLKRLENLSDFTLPLYWDNMAAGENMKTFELQSSSPEYKTVKEAFKRTVKQTVLKIERVQNIRLRHAYETQKKQISNKNRTEGGAFEKALYHGTTQDNCTSIMNTGFNRSFAGQNATHYGQGTYFAVNANYSAQPTYSKPLADGSQLMFVARVLTGIYSQGSAGMKVPPPRSNQQPHDLCDSVVDRMDQPNMFVVFHDDQAYPDYLITFK
ncbi:uncharacterized protein V6R79_016936 [Siganus canaliculatus]